jgi:hypothetical protein
MALFSDWTGRADHADAAVDAGREMLDRLAAINARISVRGHPPLAIGVGMHTGRAVVGSIGSPRRLEYTAIGDEDGGRAAAADGGDAGGLARGPRGEGARAAVGQGPARARRRPGAREMSYHARQSGRSLEMADGSLGSLAVPMGSAHEISRHRFCFANLSAESQTAPYRNSSDPWTFTGDSPEIDRQIQEARAAFVPLPEHYAGRFHRFHRALHAGSELPVTLADARTSIEWISAIYHAARTRGPVRLPLDRTHPLYGGWLP